MTTPFDTVVVGAGQAGLAAGYHLKRAGRSFILLEASAQVGGSWRHFYDSLRLFTPARYSSLPGAPFPGEPERFPTCSEVTEYLVSYARRFELPVVTETPVERVERTAMGFRLRTTSGGAYVARTIVAATGYFGGACMPQLPGQRGFGGLILHASEYRNPGRFRGQRVVVVGAGSSAVQIAVELARGARVTLASRRRVRFLPLRVLGRSAIFWTRVSGVEWLPLRERPLVYDDGEHRAALAAGRPDRRPMFLRFTSEGIMWRDGRAEAVDTVLFATGYRQHLAYLADLGALDGHGQARQRWGVSTTTPGLYYLGLQAQRTLASPTLRGVGRDAAYVVRRIGRYLEERASAPAVRPAAAKTVGRG